MVPLSGRDVHARALVGAKTGLADALAGLARGDDADRAWALAGRAAYWHAEPASAAPPAPDDLAARAWGADAREPLARAGAHIARAHLLLGDLAEAVRAMDLAVANGASPSAPPLALERCLAGLATGTSGLDTELERIESAARQDGDAPVAIEAAAARALAADDDLATALSVARRASRMAQSESYPQSSYFASLVLARTRRLAGHPHLAVRLLGSLSRVVPRQFRGWLAWELLLAGERARASELSASPASAGLAMLEATAAGDLERFDAHAASLHRSMTWAWAAREARAVVDLLDPRRDAKSIEPSLVAFAEGREDAVPRGLHALSLDLRGASGGPPAIVVARGGSARRVLAGGLPLALALEPGLRTFEPPHERLDSIIATLALSGAPSSEEALFTRVYGFGYRPRIHGGSFRVNLHRVRGRLEGIATIESGPDGIEMDVAQPFAVLDPRTAGPADARLLQVVAIEGRITAKAAAQAAGVPLRTAQRNLQALVDEGLCTRRRVANDVLYVVEDTTFSEPTRH